MMRNFTTLFQMMSIALSLIYFNVIPLICLSQSIEFNISHDNRYKLPWRRFMFDKQGEMDPLMKLKYNFTRDDTKCFDRKQFNPELLRYLKIRPEDADLPHRLIIGKKTYLGDLLRSYFDESRIRYIGIRGGFDTDVNTDVLDQINISFVYLFYHPVFHEYQDNINYLVKNEEEYLSNVIKYLNARGINFYLFLSPPHFSNLIQNIGNNYIYGKNRLILTPYFFDPDEYDRYTALDKYSIMNLTMNEIFFNEIFDEKIAFLSNKFTFKSLFMRIKRARTFCYIRAKSQYLTSDILKLYLKDSFKLEKIDTKEYLINLNKLDFTPISVPEQDPDISDILELIRNKNEEAFDRNKIDYSFVMSGQNFWGRNAHLQEFIDQMEKGIKHNPALKVELIFVNYNNPFDYPLITDLVNVPPLLLNRVKTIVVDTEAHVKLTNLKYYIKSFDHIAKNIGVRQAKGKYLIFTNPDAVFPLVFYEILNLKHFHPFIAYNQDFGYEYRSESLLKKIDYQWDLEKEKRLTRVRTNDFMIFSYALFRLIEGFPEYLTTENMNYVISSQLFRFIFNPVCIELGFTFFQIEPLEYRHNKYIEEIEDDLICRGYSNKLGYNRTFKWGSPKNVFPMYVIKV